MKAVVFLALFVALPVRAAQFPAPEKIIQTEGQFLFSDGSSYYRFDKDGTFVSGPLGESGRTIKGKWTSPESLTFEVIGTVSWINGLTPAKPTTIQMTLVIYPPTSEEKEITAFWAAHAAQPIHVYKPYFFVQQLINVADKPER